MWNPKGGQKRGAGNGLVAVAIDKDKGSQNALRWAAEHLLSRGQAVVLIHVTKPTYETISLAPTKYTMDRQTKKLFISFQCFCIRKDKQCLDIILEDTDVVKALTQYVSHAAIEKLALGAASRSGFMRYSNTCMDLVCTYGYGWFYASWIFDSQEIRADIPSCVTKAAPDFCTVYTISKGKVSSSRNASRSAPFSSPLIDQIRKLKNNFSDPNLFNADVKADWFLSKTTFISSGSR